MIKLVHPRTGGETWVHESRLDEYLARGFSIYSPPAPPVKPANTPKKAAEKKTTTKAR